MLTGLQGVLGLASGLLVGFSLGLIGGGGSILAVPLMVYVVGVKEPHLAIGTSAVAVATNAAINLVSHSRSGNVNWSCGLIFALTGVAGAAIGSHLGKLVDGQQLLFLFALLMLVIAALMLKQRHRIAVPEIDITRGNAVAVVGLGLTTGVVAGFFGIGGGFLIVPALILATRMSIGTAVGTSLIAVTAFGVTTAASYAWSGLVLWPLAAVFIPGGVVGGLLGAALSRHLAGKRGTLDLVFAVTITAVALYMLARTSGLF